MQPPWSRGSPVVCGGMAMLAREQAQGGDDGATPGTVWPKLMEDFRSIFDQSLQLPENTPPNCESTAGGDHLEILARHGQRSGSALVEALYEFRQIAGQASL